MTRVLVVTNDFPPRAGGIQSFVHALAVRLPDHLERVVVYAPAWEGAAAFDEAQPFDVVRHPTSLMLPTPAVARRATDLLRAERCTAVWFGAAAPLGLLAPALRKAGATRVVATTHGHEAGWAQLPGARSLLRKISADVDVVTYLGAYTRGRLRHAVAPHARLERLAPGVDVDVFKPGTGGAQVRDRLGLTDRRVIVCVSRLVARKGQDTLIRAMPEIRAVHPDASLLLVGSGPYRTRLEHLAREHRVADATHFAGGVPAADLPAYFDAGDLFAMPCRTRRGGLDVEGLGIVYLEASAAALPVVAGNSGGAPDAVLPGRTGEVVDGRDVAGVAKAVVGFLNEPARAKEVGNAGREWVAREWGWDAAAARLAELLSP